MVVKNRRKTDRRAEENAEVKRLEALREETVEKLASVRARLDEARDHIQCIDCKDCVNGSVMVDALQAITAAVEALIGDRE